MNMRVKDGVIEAARRRLLHHSTESLRRCWRRKALLFPHEECALGCDAGRVTAHCVPRNQLRVTGLC